MQENQEPTKDFNLCIASDTSGRVPSRGNNPDALDGLLADIGGGMPELLQKLGLESSQLSSEAINRLKSEHQEQYQALLQLLEKRSELTNNLTSFLEHSPFQNETDPRSALQFRGFKKIIDFLQNGGTDGVLWYPTGTGKSRIIANLAVQSGQKVLVLTPSLTVNKQLEDELVQDPKGDHTHLAAGSVAVVDSEHGKADLNDARIVISTYNSMEKTLAEFTPDLIVMDEQHRAGTENRNKVLVEAQKKIEYPRADKPLDVDGQLKQLDNTIPKISFSATPFNGERNFLQEGRELIDAATLKECIKCGLLAPINNRTREMALSEIELKKSANGKAEFVLAEDRQDQLNEQYLANYDEVRKELRDKKNDSEYHPQAINFCVSRKQGLKLAEIINRQEMDDYSVDSGIEHIKTVDQLQSFFTEHNRYPFAFFLDGDTNPKLDQLVRELYGKSKIHVLTSANLLDEGADLPQAEMANIPPSKSWTTYLQRLGRIIRLNPLNHEKRAYIYDHPIAKKPSCQAKRAVYMSYLPLEVQNLVHQKNQVSLKQTIEDHTRQEITVNENPIKGDNYGKDEKTKMTFLYKEKGKPKPKPKNPDTFAPLKNSFFRVDENGKYVITIAYRGGDWSQSFSSLTEILESEKTLKHWDKFYKAIPGAHGGNLWQYVKERCIQKYGKEFKISSAKDSSKPEYAELIAVVQNIESHFSNPR